jgi:hypothetical protein
MCIELTRAHFFTYVTLLIYLRTCVDVCNEICYLLLGAAQMPVALLQTRCVIAFGIVQVQRNGEKTQPKQGGTISHIVVRSEHTQAE